MNHNILIRDVDRPIFELIKSGQKKIETRAGGKYEDVKEGDTLVFTCGDEKVEKLVKRVVRFTNLDELLKEYRVEEIHPGFTTKEELEGMYATFPGYEERIKEHGLIAFELEL